MTDFTFYIKFKYWYPLTTKVNENICNKKITNKQIIKVMLFLKNKKFQNKFNT
jgi:hypothetical protein